MKRTIKYITKINPITGEKDVVGTQQMDKPIQDTEEPITIIKEEIMENQSEQGQRIFIKKIIKYVIEIDSITG